VLTNVQVLAGASSVARFDDVVVWFETGPKGGGELLAKLLHVVRGVASGSVPPSQMGAQLADLLTVGDDESVPALAAATPEDGRLRVVVHGWGAVVADGVWLSSGWADQVIADRTTFFLGRNTVTPVTPVEGSPFDLEEGIVPGDGVSVTRTPAARLAPVPTVAVTAAAVPFPGAPPPADRAGAPDPWAPPEPAPAQASVQAGPPAAGASDPWPEADGPAVTSASAPAPVEDAPPSTPVHDPDAWSEVEGAAVTATSAPLDDQPPSSPAADADPWAAPAGVPAAGEPPADEPPPSDPPAPAASPADSPWAGPGTGGGAPAPTIWPPPGVAPEPMGAAPRTPPPGPPQPFGIRPSPSAAPPPAPGRLVLDDGNSAVLERTCVLGSGPEASPAVQTGVALPLTVVGPGVSPIHAEIRVERHRVTVRDLGSAPTYILAPGGSSWIPLRAGQISELAPGSRIALGQRTVAYERP